MTQTPAMMTALEQYTKKTRHAMFLEKMEQVVPWREPCALIEPHYPKPGNGGRRWEWNGCCAFTFCNNGSTCLGPTVEEALYDRRGGGTSWASRTWVG